MGMQKVRHWIGNFSLIVVMVCLQGRNAGATEDTDLDLVGKRIKIWSYLAEKDNFIGRLVSRTADTVIVVEASLEAKLWKLPLDKIDRMEVSMGKKRDTGNGILIGTGIGVLLFLSSFMGNHFLEENESGELVRSEPDRLALGIGFIGGSAILGAIIGYKSKKDVWKTVDLNQLSSSCFQQSQFSGPRFLLTINF